MRGKLALLACLLLGLPLSAAPDGETLTEAKPKIAIVLNTILTNESSDVPELYGLDDSIEEFLKKWGIHGASLAITRNDSLVYAKGYGEADEGEAVTPATLFRVASVSKLITAAGIMRLQEEGRLRLSDKVFTPQGLLGKELYTGEITDARVFDITVEHLLRHSSGLTTRMGDPLFSTRKLMRQNGWETPPDQQKIIGYGISQRLEFDPGTDSEYSNLGYLILCEIIEKVTDMDYETWIRRNILRPAGVYDLHIAENWYEKRYLNESKYWPEARQAVTDCYDNSPRKVSRPYGGNDIRGLSGAGAWVASTPELARLVAAMDGDDTLKDILSEESIAEMTSPTDSVTFSIGWIDTKDTGEWTRTGTLSGTSALIKRYPDGECWIFVMNTSTWHGASFSKITAALFEKSREEYSSLLPSVDLFWL